MEEGVQSNEIFAKKLELGLRREDRHITPLLAKVLIVTYTR